jgi:hypothetical protein
MQTDAARCLYARRRELSEPTFGILKDQLGARRFLLRGLANVRAEFTLIATAFNLRTICRIWNKIRKVSRVGLKWPFQMSIADFGEIGHRSRSKTAAFSVQIGHPLMAWGWWSSAESKLV